MWQAPRDLNRGGIADPPVPPLVLRRQKPSRPVLVGRTVAEVERDLILETLGHCSDNRTHAAKMLGISIRTLRNKVGKYSGAGIQVPDRPAYNPQHYIEPRRSAIPARTMTGWSEGDHVTVAGPSCP
jgi:Bacterial regulatory protein, Fis family